jgi:hypothetical protein
MPAAFAARRRFRHSWLFCRCWLCRHAPPFSMLSDTAYAAMPRYARYDVLPILSAADRRCVCRAQRAQAFMRGMRDAQLRCYARARCALALRCASCYDYARDAGDTRHYFAPASAVYAAPCRCFCC